MADDESDPREGKAKNEDDAQPAHGEEAPGSHTEVRMELVDSLPGGRAVVGVEQEGEFIWLASKEHVSKQARDEFVDQLQRIVRERWWVQNWPGR